MAGELILSERRVPALAGAWRELMAVQNAEGLKTCRLIDPRRLAAIQGELALALQPCSTEHAAEVAQVLVGSYPRHAIDDPKTYSRAIVSVLADYPAAVAAQAVDRITRKCKWMPTRAEVVEECERLVAELRWAKFVADRMEDERARRIKEHDEAAASEAARRAWKEQHGDKSPLDVLRDRGLYSEGNENGEETAGREDQARRGDAGRPDKAGKPRRGRKGGNNAAPSSRGGGR